MDGQRHFWFVREFLAPGDNPSKWIVGRTRAYRSAAILVSSLEQLDPNIESSRNSGFVDHWMG